LLPACSFGRCCACFWVGVSVSFCLILRIAIRINNLASFTVCIGLNLSYIYWLKLCDGYFYCVSLLHLQLLSMADTDVNCVCVKASCCFC